MARIGAVPAGKSNFNGVVETEEPDRRAGSDYTVEQTSPGEFDFSEFFPGEGKLTPKPAAGPDALEVLNEELKPDSAPFAGANDSASSTESRRFEHPTGVYAQSTDRAGNLPSELRHEEPMPAAVPAMNQGSVGHGDPDSRAKVSISDVPVAGRSSYGETQQDVLSYAHATRACRDEFTPDENKSWRPLILTSVIAFVGGLGIAAFLLFGHRNFRALLSQGGTTTTDPFQGAAPRADVLSPSPAAPVPPAESDSDKQPNMPESSRSPGLPQLPPVAFAGVAGVRNQPPALSQPLQVGSFGKQGWIFLGQITPESTWAADYPKNVRSVPWPMEKGDHITISNEVSMRDGSRPSAHIVGRLHFGETVLVEEVALLHARLGGNFVWAKVSTAAAEKP